MASTGTGRTSVLRQTKLLALGVYPDITLAAARERHREEARKLLANGVDPSVYKKSQKSLKMERSANSFEVVARRWHGLNGSKWTESYSKKTMRQLEKDMFPWIGSRPVADLLAPDFLAVARRIEARGAVDTSHRAMQIAGQVMRFAPLPRGWLSITPVGDLRGALGAATAKHMPSVTDPQRVGELLRSFDAFKGTFTVQCSLKLAPLVFTRPQELRTARWADIDLEAALWSFRQR